MFAYDVTDIDLTNFNLSQEFGLDLTSSAETQFGS